MGQYARQLESISRARQALEAREFRLMEKAMKSDDPSDMIKAAKVYEQKNPELLKDSKSFFIDPLEFNSNLGYKDKPFSLSYTTLRRMAKTPIINSIIKTRKNQIADFAEPQENKYSTGFVIRKKNASEGEKMTKEEQKIADDITKFLLNGGKEGSWDSDDFDTFIRKLVDDTLTYDQMTFEVLRNRRGEVEGFIATDASTFRIADSYFAVDYENDYFKRNGAGIWNRKEDFGKMINGYYPSYVQVYNSVKVNEFYPWELCFAVRNPSTSIYGNGYGCSELEELINVVTGLLWGDEYNRRFFSQGSAPKGLLRVKGVNNESALQQFRQQWQSMISGVMQSWKTPVVEADVEWIDLQKSNRDMEYNNWIEYLIKIACAVYSIDPTEIGWDISRSGGNGSLFQGNQAERLQHSKDKGLYPLLKFIQRKINKYIVEQINPDYEFQFVGLNGMTISEELDMDIKKLSNFQTLNEIREKYNLKPIENGDIPLSSAYLQNKSQERMAQQAMGGGMPPMGGEDDTDEDNAGNYDDNSFSEEDWERVAFGDGVVWDDNPDTEKKETNETDNTKEEGDEEEDVEKSYSNYKNRIIKAFDNFIN